MGASVVVDGLHITAGEQTLVDHLSFAIQPGEVLALIGESGSGKTTTALALMGYARQGCSIAGGSVRIGEVDVLHLDPARQRSCAGVPWPTSRRAPRRRSIRRAPSWTRWSSRPASTAR